MFNIVPCAGRAAASLSRSPRTRERFRAEAGPVQGRLRRLPPRTPPVGSSCHSCGAAGDTSRRWGRGTAWSGSARLSAVCARGTPGLVVIFARRAGPVKLRVGTVRLVQFFLNSPCSPFPIPIPLTLQNQKLRGHGPAICALTNSPCSSFRTTDTVSRHTQTCFSNIRHCYVINNDYTEVCLPYVFLTDNTAVFGSKCPNTRPFSGFSFHLCKLKRLYSKPVPL